MLSEIQIASSDFKSFEFVNNPLTVSLSYVQFCINVHGALFCSIFVKWQVNNKQCKCYYGVTL